jgi:hypothetical protein
MHLQAWIILLGTGLGIYGIGTFAHPFWRLLRRLALGALGFELGYFVCGKSFLVGWIVAGVCLAATPLLYFIKIRQIRLPQERHFKLEVNVEDAEAEELDEITEDMEGAGFVNREEFGFAVDDTAGVCRVLVDPGKNLRASIHLMWQGSLRFRHITLTTLDKFGTKFTTTDYHGLMPQQFGERHLVRRCPNARSFLALYFEHQDFLDLFGVDQEDVVAAGSDLAKTLEEEHREIMDYSLRTGRFLAEAGGKVRFSLATTLGLWKEYMKSFLFGY